MAEMPPMPPEGEQEQAKGAPGPTDLMLGVDKGLAKVNAMMEQVDIDPKVKEGFAQALQMYRQALSSMMEQGPPGEGGPKAAPQGMSISSPEAGGNPNAKPMM